VLSSPVTWIACTDPADQCDRCAAKKPDRCRFVATPVSLVWVCMYNKDDRVAETLATKFLFGATGTPLTAGSWFQQVQRLVPSAALRGAVVAARTLRALHKPQPDVLAAVSKLTKQTAAPNSRVVELHAALLEDRAASTGDRKLLAEAAKVCRDAIAASGGGDEWLRVIAKLAKLDRRLAKEDAPEFIDPYNKRAAHPFRFVRP
jgi:hypothetical protein